MCSVSTSKVNQLWDLLSHEVCRSASVLIFSGQVLSPKTTRYDSLSIYHLQNKLGIESLLSHVDVDQR